MSNYSKYYFAKVNINWNIFTSSERVNDIKETLLPKLILNFKKSEFNKVYYNNRNNLWTIKDVNKHNGVIIKGNLVKVSPQKYGKISGNKTISKSSNDAYRAKFYYYIDSEILVFQATSMIGFKQFVKMFGNVLLRSDDCTGCKVGKLDIELLPHLYKFEKRIMQVPIEKMHFKLMPPNDPKTTNNIANILNSSQSQTTTMNFTNKNKGLQIKNKMGKLTNFFHDAIDMLKDGWGDITAKDFKGNTISSKKHPLVITLDNNKNNTKELNKEVTYIVIEKEKREAEGRKRNKRSGAKKK